MKYDEENLIINEALREYDHAAYAAAVANGQRPEPDMVDFAAFDWQTPDGHSLYSVTPKMATVEAEPLPRRDDGLIPGSPEAIEAMAIAQEKGYDIWDTSKTTPAPVEECDMTDLDFNEE